MSGRATVQSSKPALAAVRAILACDHRDPEKCPKLRSPSCQHALAYFESVEPGFEATWRDPPKHQVEATVGGAAVPAAVSAELEKIRGTLPIPAAPRGGNDGQEA